jgi:septum site-determining protein MinC
MLNQVNGTSINIKGTRDGLLFTLGRGEDEAVLLALAQELTAKREFLKGSRVTLDVGSRPLNRPQLARLLKLFNEDGLELWAVLAERDITRDAARQLGLATRIPGSATDLEGNYLRGAAEPERNAAAPPPPACLLLRETIRSGRAIHHEGDVVIIGDVNPGAEIIAGGNVIVWGRLRGLVHAGAYGDHTTLICALELNPTQLRIADQIAVAPEGKRKKFTPEQAAIRQGQIIAEAWPTKG